MVNVKRSFKKQKLSWEGGQTSECNNLSREAKSGSGVFRNYRI